MSSAEPIPSNFPITLIHFSDIHLTARPLGWRFQDFWNKRLTGWMNLRLGRGRRFRHGSVIIDALMNDIRARKPDHLIFSGDATMLGFQAEFAAAAERLGVGRTDLPGAIAVPGNHDYYVARSVREGGFERHFAPWQQGVRIGRHTYPFAQRVGPIWLIGVNSACANAWSFDARGRVGAEQLARLEQLLAQLGDGMRILVTHYPISIADGGYEKPWRRLRDWQHLEKIAKGGKIQLWLHGHRHGPYIHHPTAARPFGQICAGSATQADRWSYHQYIIDENRILIHRRSWSAERKQFEDSAVESMELIHF
jgi:3',5'-cyclic AMP phosphodiesterase CpdA